MDLHAQTTSQDGMMMMTAEAPKIRRLAICLHRLCYLIKLFSLLFISSNRNGKILALGNKKAFVYIIVIARVGQSERDNWFPANDLSDDGLDVWQVFLIAVFRKPVPFCDAIYFFLCFSLDIWI